MRLQIFDELVQCDLATASSRAAFQSLDQRGAEIALLFRLRFVSAAPDAGRQQRGEGGHLLTARVESQSARERFSERLLAKRVEEEHHLAGAARSDQLFDSLNADGRLREQ